MIIPEIVSNGATFVSVFVEDTFNGDIKGRWTSDIIRSQRFRSCLELIKQLDSYYDENRMVGASTKIRSFYRNNSFTYKGADKTMDDMIFTNDKGEKATFIVQVMFRQNSTWQGRIKWVEKDKELQFRSTMEMLKIMDEALSSQSFLSENAADI